MKVHELLQESDNDSELTAFLTKWYRDHEMVKPETIDELIKKYPEFKFSDDVRRAVTITKEDAKALRHDDGETHSWRSALDHKKVEDFISKHEPNRYVSGSQNSKGFYNFLENGNGLGQEDFVVDCEYTNVEGLSLHKMAASIKNKTHELQRIIDVTEVIFKSKGAKFWIQEIMEPKE